MLCEACNGTGLRSDVALCPVCGGSGGKPQPADRDPVIAEAPVPAVAVEPVPLPQGEVLPEPLPDDIAPAEAGIPSSTESAATPAETVVASTAGLMS